MYKIPLAEIKQKIVASGKLDATLLTTKIKEKINELSGLISEEGAAHIIANELNVELTDSNKEQLKIKEIYAGMKTVSTVGKVVRKFDVREFSKEDRQGKVCSLVLGDETGTIRVVFWNDQVDLLTEVQENDILIIKDAYARDNRGMSEIHLGEKGTIELNPNGVEIKEVRSILTNERKRIADLQEGEQGVEILGTVVQVFDPRFFTICPECNKRVHDNSCNEHGQVLPVLSYVLNAVLDDGSGTIRAVFWKEQTNNLIGKTVQEISSYKDNLAAFEKVKTDLLGEQFKLTGRVTKNEVFGRLEFNIQIVEKASAKEEIARLEK